MVNDQIEISNYTKVESISPYTLKTLYSCQATITHLGFNEWFNVSGWNEIELEKQIKDKVEYFEKRWLMKLEWNKINKQVEDFKKLDSLLINGLDYAHSFNFEKLIDKSEYSIANPNASLDRRLSQIPHPKLNALKEYRLKPVLTNYDHLFWFERLFMSAEIKLNTNNNEILSKAHEEEDLRVDSINEQITDQNKVLAENYIKEKEKLTHIVTQETEHWQKSKAIFDSNQLKHNENIKIINENYIKGDLIHIVKYCELVLLNSNYPFTDKKIFQLEFKPETKILIVEYSLPAIEDLPTLKEYKQVSGVYREYHATETQMQKIFENTLYNVTLRTLYELFYTDKINAIDAISFNGWVNGINKATGKKVNNCILSIQVKKSEFLGIDLRHVDPKTCFKNFKGVSSSKLFAMIAIQPIMQMDKKDKRFTSHYDVAEFIDDSTNLAAMDWEDFEHLIREVFGKEFSSNGGEVKVTQASRDGGVDAIAFDPDPIRGGKIIIQAKRYTNTVGVAAVRDLYGTVMNEGANKGILVTTADYGPDAYEFVKGKPLTLMNGAHLLYLLEKHGHKAKIDIAEARRILKEQ